MDGVLALLQSTPSSLLQNVPMRKLTVDLDVKLSRDRQANRATKTNMCMRLREYHSEAYTPLPDSTTVTAPTSSSIADADLPRLARGNYEYTG